jgi:hypothetical protein
MSHTFYAFNVRFPLPEQNSFLFRALELISLISSKHSLTVNIPTHRKHTVLHFLAKTLSFKMNMGYVQ